MRSTPRATQKSRLVPLPSHVFVFCLSVHRPFFPSLSGTVGSNSDTREIWDVSVQLRQIPQINISVTYFKIVPPAHEGVLGFSMTGT